MYPTGQKFGIHSVENTFFGAKDFFFLTNPETIYYFEQGGKHFIYFEQGGKHFIYFEQNEKDFIYFHIFLNPPPPPQLSNGPPLTVINDNIGYRVRQDNLEIRCL